MGSGGKVGSGTPLRKLISGVAILLVAAAFIAYAQREDLILELKDVQFFKAQQINSSPVTIKLSGLAFHSSLAIQDITTAQYDESLQVLVTLTPAMEGLSGNLNYTLAVSRVGQYGELRKGKGSDLEAQYRHRTTQITAHL